MTQAVDTPSFSLLTVAEQNSSQFAFWALIGVLTVFCVFFISTLRFLERHLDPIFLRIRKYATFIARFTIGVSFLAGAYYQAIYGPEIPLSGNFGVWSGFITAVLVIIGVMAILGLYARTAALIALGLYLFAVSQHGWYMLTYVNYLGEIIVMLIIGAHGFSLDNYFARRRGSTIDVSGKSIHVTVSKFGKLKNYFTERSLTILRVLFGISLIYSSVYAKVIYNNLALFTVEKYHLDKLLGFEPHFLVLGAAIVEILIGTFFILGIEIRFTALFFLFWLCASLLFFGEVVWPHLILIGIPIAYLFYGYDDHSVEGWFFRKKKYEPVL